MSRIYHSRGRLNKENKLTHKGPRDHNTLRWHNRHGYPMYFRDMLGKFGLTLGVGRYYAEAVEVHSTAVEQATCEAPEVVNIRSIDGGVSHVVVGSEQVLHIHYTYIDPKFDGSDRWLPRLMGRFVHQHKGKVVRRGHTHHWQFNDLLDK
jgi:hypothetical protein